MRSRVLIRPSRYSASGCFRVIRRRRPVCRGDFHGSSLSLGDAPRAASQRTQCASAAVFGRSRGHRKGSGRCLSRLCHVFRPRGTRTWRRREQRLRRVAPDLRAARARALAEADGHVRVAAARIRRTRKAISTRRSIRSRKWSRVDFSNIVFCARPHLARRYRNRPDHDAEKRKFCSRATWIDKQTR